MAGHLAKGAGLPPELAQLPRMTVEVVVLLFVGAVAALWILQLGLDYFRNKH